MIFNYYKRQYQSQNRNSRVIHMKKNDLLTYPFLIPQSHFQPNSKHYQSIKQKCQKIKKEFSFIKNQIQRERQHKKQKREQITKFPQNAKIHQNCQKIQREMSTTCRNLLKYHNKQKQNRQSKNRNKSQLRFKQNIQVVKDTKFTNKKLVKIPLKLYLRGGEDANIQRIHKSKQKQIRKILLKPPPQFNKRQASY